MAERANQNQTAFQRLMFSALARKGLHGTPFSKAGHKPEKQQIITPIPKDNDKQTGLGCTAEWFTGTKLRRWPKTGVSSFQWYRRVIGPQQCETRVMNGHREVGLQTGRQCSRKAVAGMRDCSQHQKGNGRKARGTLVELLPEETPVLLCDR